MQKQVLLSNKNGKNRSAKSPYIAKIASPHPRQDAWEKKTRLKTENRRPKVSKPNVFIFVLPVLGKRMHELVQRVFKKRKKRVF